MPKIRKIEPVMPVLPARKRVAAYARVSMETERLHHSLSTQISYYSDLIQRNPEWEYAGVYADEERSYPVLMEVGYKELLSLFVISGFHLFSCKAESETQIAGLTPPTRPSGIAGPS